MSKLPSNLWEKLNETQPTGEGLAARLAVPDISKRLLAALDSESRRHFLIELASGEPAIVDKQSRGVSVETRQLALRGNKPVRYIDLVCIDPAGNDVFQNIGNELIERIGFGFDAAESVRLVLAKWRRFWGQLPRDVLSRNEQIGLLAELYFLNYWLVPAVGAFDAVKRWQGPSNSRHDFEWKGTSVEVKATTSVQGTVHRINGIDQLLPPEGGELFIFSLKLSEGTGEWLSLPVIVAACCRSIEEDCDALSEFESRLHLVGYSPAHDDEYGKLRLRIVEQGIYSVQDGFPRLTRDCLRHGVPAGVENIGYDIDLESFGHLKVDREGFLADCV